MVAIPEPGHRVKVSVSTHNGTVHHTGLVLPPAAKGHFSIKLDNGYNVSYPTEDLQEWGHAETVDAAPPAGLHAPEQDESLPRVRLIHTGGTIASKVDYATGAVDAKFEPEEMLDAVPELADIARLDAVKIGNMFSDDIRMATSRSTPNMLQEALKSDQQTTPMPKQTCRSLKQASTGKFAKQLG